MLIAIPITAAALVAVAVSGGGGARAVQTQASGDPRGIVITAGGTQHTAVEAVGVGMLVPLTSWTLMARRFAGSAPVISGTTPASGTILSGVPYVLSESSVPGYQQQVDPGADLVQGATGSWHCVQVVDGVADSEVFEGGNGAVIAAPGEHIRCTATNIPVSVPVTG